MNGGTWFFYRVGQFEQFSLTNSYLNYLTCLFFSSSFLTLLIFYISTKFNIKTVSKNMNTLVNNTAKSKCRFDALFNTDRWPRAIQNILKIYAKYENKCWGYIWWYCKFSKTFNALVNRINSHEICNFFSDRNNFVLLPWPK